MAHAVLSPQNDPEFTASPIKASGWAWGICWLMFASTVLNYMDRQAMTLVGPYVKGEFHLTNADFGWVLAAFQLTYAAAQVPAGFLVDRWDLRRTYAGAVALWSLAGILAAFSPTLGILMALRALLGVGESFNWPCALRTTAQILPPADRSLGNGIFNSGAAIGAVITPLIVTPLAAAYGWRTAFIVVGVAGLAWVAAWLFLIRGERGALLKSAETLPGELDAESPGSPAPTLSKAACFTFGGILAVGSLLALSSYWIGRAAITWGIALVMFGLLFAALALPEPSLRGARWAEGLGAVVRKRRFWILVVVSISINVCWHFLVNWLPTYFKDDRGMSFLESGLWTSVLFLAADFGNLGGGAFSRALASRGIAPVKARMAVIAGCTVLITSGVWVGWIQNDYVLIALLCIMAMGTAAFMANYFAFAQEVSSRYTGLIIGILGGLGNLGAASLHPIAGLVKDQTGGFGPIFVVVGLLPFLGLAALVFGWGHEPLADGKSS